MTYKAYLRHPVFLAVRDVVLAHAQGRCVRCGTRATEVHHLRYPPPHPRELRTDEWGTFDVPSNLQAVCHPCHCILEGRVS